LPDRREPHALLAVALVERGQPSLATEAFAAADAASEPSTRPGLLMLYSARAEAARMTGDPSGEASWLMRAIHLAPPSSRGAAAFDPAAAGPGDLRTRLTRAVARRTIDPRLSGEAIERAIADARLLLIPVHPLERYRKAALYGLERERLALVKEAIGTAEARKGNIEGAKRTLEEALKETPGDPGLTRQLAAVHALACRAELNAATRKALARKASDTIADAADRCKATGRMGYELYLAAAVYARDADLLEQSVRLLERAARCGEGGIADARLDRCAGVVFDQWGRVPSAIESYRKALQRAPGDPDAGAIEARLAVLEAKRAR
jgi:tetratricopeptide (TPR) repeat protein